MMKGRASDEHGWCSLGLQIGAQPGVPRAGRVGWEADDRLSWPAFGWIVVALVFLLAAIVGLSHVPW